MILTSAKSQGIHFPVCHDQNMLAAQIFNLVSVDITYPINQKIKPLHQRQTKNRKTFKNEVL